MVAVVGLHSQRSLILGTVNNEVLYYLSRFAMPCFFMTNGYLILNRNDFTFTYYKRKIVNMIRVLITGGYSVRIFVDSFEDRYREGRL